MKNLIKIMSTSALALLVVGCQDSIDKDNPPLDYTLGKYKTANDVAKSSLLTHWALDGNGNEEFSGKAPSKESNVTYETGIKGQCATFNVGYLMYPEIDKLSTINSSFTVALWAKFKNNQSTPTMLFSLTKPETATPTNLHWAGSINIMSETGWYPDTELKQVIKGYLVKNTGTGENGQDTRNNPGTGGVQDNLVAGTWTHYVIRYDASSEMFTVFANGVKISNPDWELRKGTGNMTLFTPAKPLIGSFGSVITGNAESWQKSMVGSIDEVRVYNAPLTNSEINTLYILEKKGL